MGDVKNGYQATPNATLEQQMMDACAPKSEREWWAFVEIGRLRAEVDLVIAQREAWRVSALTCQRSSAEFAANADRLRADVEALRSLVEVLAQHDSYSTEYDGRMIALCPDCGGQDGTHTTGCVFVRAKAHIDAAPAAPQQAGQFDHLAGRGMHELRFDELTPYVLSLLAGRGQDTPDVRIAIDWIVSELKRKTNDERALAVKLDAIRAAPQQAEPVGYFVNDESDDQWHQVDYEQRNGADTYPLYLHPPAAEVQLLRDAVAKLSTIVRVPNAEHIADEHNAAVAFLRRALEGGA